MSSKGTQQQRRGVFILIEGLDRTGKSTQCAKLVEKIASPLSSKEVQLLKFPNRETNIGKLINTYLCDKEFQLSDQSAHLLFSANRWECKEEIESLLQRGVTIIVDRYVYSGVAYSSAKGLDFEWCYAPDKGLPRPDLTIFLNLEKDLTNLTNREGYGEERYEVQSFQQKVKTQFQRFFTNEKNWQTLNVDGLGIEQVESKVWALVEELVTNGVTGEIEYL